MNGDVIEKVIRIRKLFYILYLCFCFMKINWWYLIGFVVICNLIGSIGGIWSGGDSEWYKNLNKPSFNPPSWVFAPIWILLFSMMGVALYFVFMSPNSNLRNVAFVLFGIQFVFNVLWSYLFFGIHEMGFAFLNIVILELLIVATGVFFHLVKPILGFLFIPYFLWVGFASVLNYFLWRLN